MAAAVGTVAYTIQGAYGLALRSAMGILGPVGKAFGAGVRAIKLGIKVARKRFSAPKKPVLVDSNVIPQLRSNPALSGRIGAGETPVVSNVTRPELRNAVSTGSLKGVPRALDNLPVVNPPSSLNTRINIRGQLPAGRGRFGGGVIGAQALENNMPLITNDKALRGVIQSMGGAVR